MIYRVSDLTFASDLAFPQLQTPVEQMPECRLLLHRDAHSPLDSCQWSRHERLPDGRTWLSFGRSGNGYCIRFHELADFTIDFSKDQVTAHPCPEGTDELVGSLFLDKIVPLYMSRRRLVLHASAVGVGTGCVAFVGASGRGKSTLAAYLESRGCPLLTDDYLVVQERQGQLIAVPSYSKLNLRADSAAALGRARAAVAENRAQNRRCEVQNHQTNAATLLCIFVLEGAGIGGGVQLVPFDGREAFMELVRNAFSIDPDEEESLQANFANIAAVMPYVRMSRLSYPRDYAVLPEVAERILEAISPSEKALTRRDP
jgi:hypothetical protein